MEKNGTQETLDPKDVKRNATFSLPVGVWLWLHAEARRRNTNASALIVDLVAREQAQAAA